MGSRDTDMNFNLNFQLGNMDEARDTMSSLAETAAKVPAALSEAAQLVPEINNIAPAQDTFRHMNVMPQSMRTAINQMADAVKYQVQRSDYVSKHGGDELQTSRAAAYVDASSRVFSSAMLKLNAVMDSVTRAFGNDLNALTSFGRNLSDIQTKMLGVTNTKLGKATAFDISNAHIAELIQDRGGKSFAAGLKSLLKTIPGNDAGQVLSERQLVEALVPFAVPMTKQRDYWTIASKRDNRINPNVKYEQAVTTYKQLYPKLFQAEHLPLDPRKMDSAAIAAQKNYRTEKLSAAEWDAVRSLAGKNYTFEKALTQVGLAQRGVVGNRAGVQQMPAQPPRKQQLAEALGVVWQMNAEALEGAPAFMKNLADRSGFVQQQLGDKSSRVPSETKQIGRALADIDITPVIPHSNKPRRSAFKNWTSIDSEIAVRPDQFQIQSLTLRDFMSGKFLPASGPVKYTYNDDDENFDERTSKYIFLSQSAMTDRVGLHGHNTFGNGSKTDNSRPSLIRVDFGNDMFAKDDSNNLIYGDDGLPMRNAKSEALFNKILQHNKKIAYTFDGQQREYSYASITPDGYEEGFVPVATRANGTMIMLREDVFTRTTKEDLERMGVSALDNYVPQNYRFKNKTEMFKTKEAVNRSLTDSVKISDLGRAELTPEDVMKRMAFVDFGAFVKDEDTALDGTSFAAPGVLPAGAAVIRMGFNAIKGTMAELDFRNYIKHLTGNDSLNEFYMPSMGATDEMKKFFAAEFSRPESQGNMRNAFTRRFEGKSFDDYFVNVMDENLSYMFSNTMVKTPWLKESGLTQNQIRERVAMMMFNDGKPIDGAGFRLHHTDTEKITTDQATLSHTLSRLLMMDDDDVRKEASVFATRIGRLINDPEYAVREVFNNPNDEFHQMIRENPALAYTDERAQRELQTEIDRSYKDFYQHRLSSRGRAAMGLAVIDPYYAFAPAAAANGQTINPESIHLGDEDIAYSPASMGRPGFVGDISAYRNPLTPGQAQTLSDSKSKDFLASMASFGGTQNAIYLSPNTLNKMGGGDFDGDTIQLVFDDLAKRVREAQAQLKPAMDKAAVRAEVAVKQFKTDKPAEQAPVSYTYKDAIDALYGGPISQMKMGAVDRSEGYVMDMDWSDADKIDALSDAAYGLSEAYDIDSTFWKTQQAAVWSSAMNKYRGKNNAFSKVFKNNFGKIAEGDYEHIDAFANYNLPSIFNSFTSSVMLGARNAPMSSAVSKMAEAQDRFGVIKGVNKTVEELLAYEDSGEDSLASAYHGLGEYYKLRNRIFSQQISTGAAVSKADEDQLRLLARKYQARANDATNGASRGGVALDSAAGKALLRQQKAVEQDVEYIKTIGFTERNVQNGIGYGSIAKHKDGSMLLTDVTSGSDFVQAFDAAQDAEAREKWKENTALGGVLASTIRAENVNRQSRNLMLAKHGFSTWRGDFDGKHGWSYSQWQKLRKDPDAWYKRYVINGGKQTEPDSVEAIIGSAFHEGAEYAVKSTINPDLLTDGDYKGLNPSEIAETYLEKKLPATLRPGDSKHWDYAKLSDAQKSRYDRMKASISQLSSKQGMQAFMASAGIAEFLDAERVVNPDFAPEGFDDVWTTGKMDVLAKLKTGKVAAMDWKPSLQSNGSINAEAMDHVFNQQLVYAHAERKRLQEQIDKDGTSVEEKRRLEALMPSKLMALTYLEDPSSAPTQGRMDLGNGFAAYVRDYDEIAAEKLLADAQYDVGRVLYAAQQGQLHNLDFIKHPENYIRGAADVDESPIWVKRVSSETRDAAAEKSYLEAQRQSQQQTGEGIAFAASGYRAFDEHIKGLQDLNAHYLSMARKAEHPNQSFNRWEAERFKLQYSSDQELEQLKNTYGKTDDDYQVIEAKKQARIAYENFERARMSSSTSDLNHFIDTLSKPTDTSSGLNAYIKQSEELTKSLEAAKGAYLSLSAAVQEEEAAKNADDSRRQQIVTDIAELEAERDELKARLGDKANDVHGAYDKLIEENDSVNAEIASKQAERDTASDDAVRSRIEAELHELEERRASIQRQQADLERYEESGKQLDDNRNILSGISMHTDLDDKQKRVSDAKVLADRADELTAARQQELLDRQIGLQMFESGDLLDSILGGGLTASAKATRDIIGRKSSVETSIANLHALLNQDDNGMYTNAALKLLQHSTKQEDQQKLNDIVSQLTGRIGELEGIKWDDYQATLEEHYQASEDLRLSRARRQNTRLNARANKALRGKNAKYGSYFERAEYERQQEIAEQDNLIEGHNVSIEKGTKDLLLYDKDSKAYADAQTQLGALRAQRSVLIQRQTQLEDPGAVVGDLESFTKLLSAHGGDSPAKALVDDFEEIEASIDSAKKAYAAFVAKMEEKRSAGEELTEEEQLQLGLGAAHIARIESMAYPIMQMRQQYAELMEHNHLDSLLDPFGKSPTSIEDSAALATIKYRTSVVETIEALKERDGNGYTKFKTLSDEDRERYLAKYQAIDFDKYNKEYIDRTNAQQKYETESRRYRLEDLAIQGDNLGRNLWLSSGSGLISNSINRWRSGKEQYRSRLNNLRGEMHVSQERINALPVGSQARLDEEQNLGKLNTMLKETSGSAKLYGSALGAAASVTDALQSSVGNLAAQFGRQIFHMAIQEAKRFVLEFDAAMTEIQMVTLKTDAALANLGDGLIQTAIDMKVSVSDVTSAATTLYRQGLDDDEVAVRMEDVIKFAKVASIKTDEASKIITTALSNNLVSSSQEAMDVLVAQGDAAATSAEEIAKGMQKSAASAKQAGVSYDQLVTMLTIITSKTQLGGSQAGTALQTLMYRLYRVKEGDDYYDENGNRVGANEATRALSQLGVNVYDDNGNQRGAYDILVDVAKNWNQADTISQEMVLNALGAGRQRSNIATLIQGLAEDDGAQADKYMGQAEGSEGITDQKFVAHLDSLQGALDEVKSSFDALINAFNVSGTATGFLSFQSKVLQGLTTLEEEFGAVSTAFDVFIGLQATAAVLLAVVQGVSKDWSGLVKTATTLVLGSAAVFGLKKASEVGEKVQSRPDETSTVSYDYVGSEQTDAKKHQFYASLISETQELYHKENRSIQEDYNLRTNIAVLTNAFGDAASSLSSATGDVESFSAAIRDTTTALNEQQKADYNTRKREVLASLSDAFWNADYTGNKAVLSPQARSISANRQGLTPELAAYAAWLIEEKGLFDTTSDAEMARNNLLPGTVLGTLPPIRSTNDLSRLYANDNDSKNDAENVYAMINAAYNDMDYGYGFLAYKNHMAQKSVKDALSSTVQPMLSQHLSSDQADDILSTMWYRINDIVPVSAHTPSDRINEAMQTVFSDMQDAMFYENGTYKPSFYTDYVDERAQPGWYIADMNGQRVLGSEDNSVNAGGVSFAAAQRQQQTYAPSDGSQPSTWTSAERSVAKRLSTPTVLITYVDDEDSDKTSNTARSFQGMQYNADNTIFHTLGYIGEDVVSGANDSENNAQKQLISMYGQLLSQTLVNTGASKYKAGPSNEEIFDPEYWNTENINFGGQKYAVANSQSRSDLRANKGAEFVQDNGAYMVDKNLYFSRQIELMNKLTTAANNEDYIELYNALVYLYLGGYLNEALDEKNYNMNLGYAIDDKIFTDVNSLTSYAYTAHNDQFDGSVTSSYQLLRANASTNENYRPSQALQAILRANTSYELSEDAIAKSRIDELYETIVLSGANSLQDIGRLKDDGKLLDFESVLSDNPDLANIFAQYAYEDEQGNFLAEDPNNLGYLLFMSELSKRGTSTLDANSMSLYSQAAMATNTLTQLLTGNEVNDASLSDLQQIVGSSVVSKYNLFGQAQANKINENIGFDSNGNFDYGQTPQQFQDAWEADEDHLNELGEIVQPTAQDYIYWRQTYNEDIDNRINEGHLEPSTYEKEYAAMQIDNFAANRSDYTAKQKHYGGSVILDQIAAGTYSEFLDSQSRDMTSAYLGMLPSLSQYANWAYNIEQLGVNNSSGEQLTISDLAKYEVGSEEYQLIDEALQSMGSSAEQALDVIQNLNAELSSEGAKGLAVYGDLAEEIGDNLAQWKGDARDVASANKKLNSTLTAVANNQYFRNKYMQGDRTSETTSAIANMIGLDEEIVKANTELTMNSLETSIASDQMDIDAIVSPVDEFLQKAISNETFSVNLPKVVADAGGSIDFSSAINQYAAESEAELRSLANLLEQLGMTAKIVAFSDEDSTKYRIVVDQLGSMAGRRSSGGGGGGGGGKSAAETLIDEQKKEQTVWEHIIKMIQYEQTRYANAGELGNQAIMIRHEINEEKRQIEMRQAQIDKLKEQIALTKEYSDDWYSLRDAIMSAEEAIKDLSNTIEENEKKIEELRQQTLKLHTDLEDAVVEEIEARIQKERDMLDGSVAMQDIILEAIRERYRKEWELMQEDLAKKKEALQEEIALIDERLQRRKDAEDEAAKHEELVELQKQLALISMDSTRTKDQAELREKIAEIEDELAWDTAEDEAEAQKKELQEQSDAYDRYEQEYQKYLDEYLEDANNFADEVNEVLKLNQEDLMTWLKENVEAFSLSLDDAQEQMVQGWTDTFKQMKGIVDTYWEEVAKTLSSRENFLNYMMNSDTYLNASDDEKAQMEYNWGTMYDDWVAAKLETEDAENWEHDKNYETSETPTAPKSDPTTRTYYGGFDSKGQWIGGIGFYGETRSAAEWLAKQRGIIQPQYSNTPVTLPAKAVEDLLSNKISAYATGGMVDYTGLAWVDGSITRPEAFLSAADTELMRSMLDAWHFAASRPYVSNLDGVLGKASSGASFGDISITITEASFADDADFEEVARRVGDAFTKELSKQGFRTAAFNF